MKLISLSPEQEARVDAVIIGRFYNHLSPYDVSRWLSNFESEEFDKAITILESIEYFRDEEIASILNDKLNQLILDLEAHKRPIRLHFLPIGRAGKSGHAIEYYVKNNLKFVTPRGIDQHHYYAYPGELDCSSFTEQDVVVFVDDFVGSGDSFRKAVNLTTKSRDPQTNQIIDTADEIWGIKKLMAPNAAFKVALISVIIMEKGADKLHKLYPNLLLYGEFRKKCFTPNDSVFGSYLKAKTLREFCYKYGTKLTRTKYLKYDNGALGYSNSQSLVAFAHAVPNNTLPIIWASVTNTGEIWQPLFARQYEIRNKLAYSNRVENSRWLFKLKNLIMGSDEEYYHVENLYTHINYQLVYLLRLIKENVSENIIVNQMSITSNELSFLYQEGFKKGLWDSDHELTPVCIKACEEVDKIMKIEYTKSQKEVFNIANDCETMYIPETFKGLS